MNGSKIQSFFTFKNSAQNQGVLEHSKLLLFIFSCYWQRCDLRLIMSMCMRMNLSLIHYHPTDQNAVSFMQVAAEIFGYHKESMVIK